MTETPGDSYHLLRFVNAQAPVYAQAVAELKRGYKTGHWMWFIFPQIAGLGTSEMARRFAISSLAEADAYMSHPVLGVRLGECAGLALNVSGKSAYEIFGTPDDMKFRSSMTLFARVSGPNPVFEDNIRKYFNGEHDPLTAELLRPEG